MRITPTAVITIPDPRPIETTYVPRSISLRAQDFAKHGYTAGCPSCAQIVTGIGTRKPHSVECRARMEELIAQEDEGSRRVQAQNERKDKWIADHVQANAEEPATPTNVAASSEGGKAVQASASASASAPQVSENVDMERDEEIVPIEELDDEAMEALRSTADSDNHEQEEQADAEMEEDNS